jgi:hypothetical protein
MSTNIDTHFIEQYESELYVAFQNMGNVLRPRVRVKQVTGTTAHFPRIGIAPAAQPKGRKGKVPLMDILRDRVAVDLTDYYGADLIDTLDELKTNVQEKTATQSAIVSSLGRTWDDIATAAIASTTNANNSLGSADTFSSDSVHRLILEQFGSADAMGGGQNHALVTWKAWADMLQLLTFVNTEYGGDASLTSDGQKPKMYYGFHYAPFSRLPKHSSGNPTNLWWHGNVVGVAENKSITASTDFLPDYDATFIMGKMSLGGLLIDATGAIKRRYGG